MVALLCEENGGELPAEEDLFVKMGELFKLHTVKIKKSFRFGRNSKRFQVTKVSQGYKLYLDV